jgi:hypothetical protein
LELVIFGLGVNLNRILVGRKLTGEEGPHSIKKSDAGRGFTD